MKNILFNKKSSRGQSLVEVVIALGIIGVSLAAMMSLTVATKNLLYQSTDVTKATTLAQEGIEIVQHQRDIGCSFSKITDSSGNLVANKFYIAGDTNQGTSTYDETLKSPSLIPTLSSTRADSLVRTVYIYSVDNIPNTDPSYTSDMSDIGNSNFQTGDYDRTDQYYLISVTVEKGGSKLSSAKMIMAK